MKTSDMMQACPFRIRLNIWYESMKSRSSSTSLDSSWPLISSPKINSGAGSQLETVTLYSAGRQTEGDYERCQGKRIKPHDQ